MIKFIKATAQNMDKALESRYETVKAVNGLEECYSFSAEFVSSTQKYFDEAEQTTVLALDGDTVIGCATICYIWILPTMDHPGGKRGHIMNVYTNRTYQRQGIGYRLIRMLIEEAKLKGITELSLDATKDGRPLYEKCGFVASTEGMILNLN